MALQQQACASTQQFELRVGIAAGGGLTQQLFHLRVLAFANVPASRQLGSMVACALRHHGARTRCRQVRIANGRRGPRRLGKHGAVAIGLRARIRHRGTLARRGSGSAVRRLCTTGLRLRFGLEGLRRSSATG
ncbi:hypothetical protein N8D55_22075 [Xanthomonas hortorum pv. pelargonii]|nr:hypothetical protein N8D55_22075 [Xanthomonas hortorum pv. pelargonii]